MTVLSPESIETSGKLRDLMSKNERLEEVAEKQRAFDHYLASLSVEDLLRIQWFMEHRHAADMAAVSLAIELEDAKRGATA